MQNNVGAILPGSREVNGQLVPTQNGAAYAPMAFGPVHAGAFTPVPTLPAAGAISSPAANVAAAGASPWSLRDSPLPWAIAALIIGLLGLRYVHWRAR